MGPMRMTALGVLGPLALVAGCAGGPGDTSAGPERTPRVTPAEPPSPSPSPSPSRAGRPAPDPSTAPGDGVHVYTTYGDEQGHAAQRPDGLTASEVTTFTNLSWDSWTSDAARGEGDLSGTWCLPECQEDPFHVPVRLHDPTTVAGTTYYSAYTVPPSADLPDEMRDRMEQADGGHLMLPTGHPDNRGS